MSRKANIFHFKQDIQMKTRFDLVIYFIHLFVHQNGNKNLLSLKLLFRIHSNNYKKSERYSKFYYIYIEILKITLNLMFFLIFVLFDSFISSWFRLLFLVFCFPERLWDFFCLVLSFFAFRPFSWFLLSFL